MVSNIGMYNKHCDQLKGIGELFFGYVFMAYLDIGSEY